MQNKNSVKNWFSAKFTENINSGEQEMNLSNIILHERNMWVILAYKLCLSINNPGRPGELKQSSPDSEPGVPNVSNLCRWGVPAPPPPLDCSDFISFLIYLFLTL